MRVQPRAPHVFDLDVIDDDRRHRGDAEDKRQGLQEIDDIGDVAFFFQHKSLAFRVNYIMKNGSTSTARLT